MKKTALVLAAALASSSAFAASMNTTPTNGPGFYAGVNPGYSYVDLGAGSDPSLTDTGFGINAHAGYMFNQYVGAELGYTKYANVKFNMVGANATYKLYDITAAVKGAYHFNPQWSAFGKLGAASMHSTASGTSGFVDIPGNMSESKTAPYAEIGAGFDATPNLTINAGWSYAMGGHDENSTSSQLGNASLFYAGVDYHF